MKESTTSWPLSSATLMIMKSTTSTSKVLSGATSCRKSKELLLKSQNAMILVKSRTSSCSRNCRTLRVSFSYVINTTTLKSWQGTCSRTVTKCLLKSTCRKWTQQPVLRCWALWSTWSVKRTTWNSCCSTWEDSVLPKRQWSSLKRGTSWGYWRSGSKALCRLATSSLRSTMQWPSWK